MRRVLVILVVALLVMPLLPSTGEASAITADPLTNHPPTAPTNIETQYGQVIRAGVSNTFTASGSTDQDGDTITYEYKIVDVTTGATIRDWSTNNAWTPSSTHLYHEIRVYARAKDSGGALSGEYDEYFFVLPAKTINDVPFDPNSVNSKVEFNLTGSLSATILQNILTADSNGMILWKYFDQDGYLIIEWAKIESTKITIYSNNKFGPWIVPYITYDDVGSPKWDEDFVNQLLTYAKDAGYATSDVAVTGSTSYVVGITEPATLWALGDKRHMTGLFDNAYTFQREFYNKPGLSIIPESWFQVYSWGDINVRERWIDWYDVGESAGSNPEDYLYHDGGGTWVRLIKKDLAPFTAWQENQSFNFYLKEYGHWSYVKTSWRLLGIAKKGSSGESAVLGDARLLFTTTVYPMKTPRTIIFRFRDDAGNVIQSANVWINGQYVGSINDGQNYTVEYTGRYTITASAPHHYNATVEVYVEMNNQEVYITLDRVLYNVTVKVTDQVGNPLVATLYIDNVNYGTVNGSRTLQIPYGQHTFKAIGNESYSGETTALIDHDGQEVTVVVAHPVWVTFIIQEFSLEQGLVDLANVTLIINNGAPQLISSGDAIQLVPGTYTFEFKKDGYNPTTYSAEIESATTIIAFLSKNTTVVGFPEAPDFFINLPSEIDTITGMFSHWPGGEFLSDLLKLDIKGFITHLLRMDTTAGGRPMNAVGTFLTLVIWLNGTLAVWFYHKNPFTTLAFGRVLYEGLSYFVTFNPGALGIPVAALSLYWGYLAFKQVVAKWSGVT